MLVVACCGWCYDHSTGGKLQSSVYVWSCSAGLLQLCWELWCERETAWWCTAAVCLCNKNKRLFCFVVVYSGWRWEEGKGLSARRVVCVRFSFFCCIMESGWHGGVSSAMAACLGLVSCSLLSSLSGPLGGAFPSVCDGLFTLLVNCTRLACCPAARHSTTGAPWLCSWLNFNPVWILGSKTPLPSTIFMHLSWQCRAQGLTSPWINKLLDAGLDVVIILLLESTPLLLSGGYWF
jgi:hypothetical protein